MAQAPLFVRNRPPPDPSPLPPCLDAARRLEVDVDGVEVHVRLVGPVRAERRDGAWHLPRLLPTEAATQTIKLIPCGCGPRRGRGEGLCGGRACGACVRACMTGWLAGWVYARVGLRGFVQWGRADGTGRGRTAPPARATAAWDACRPTHVVPRPSVAHRPHRPARARARPPAQLRPHGGALPAAAARADAAFGGAAADAALRAAGGQPGARAAGARGGAAGRGGVRGHVGRAAHSRAHGRSVHLAG